MTKRILAYLVSLGILTGLAACGGGGGGGGGAAAPTVSVQVDKSVALTTTDAVTVAATVATAPAANTVVTLRTTGAARFANTSTHITRTIIAGSTTSNSTTLSDGTAETVTLTAAATSYTTGSALAKFVTLASLTGPVRAEVSVKSKAALSDIMIYGVEVNLLSTGANSALLNAATLDPTLLALITANPSVAAYTPTASGPNPVQVSLTNAKLTKTDSPALNVAAGVNFIKLNYDITFDGVNPAFPAFAADAVDLAYWDAAGILQTPLMSLTDAILTVNYYNGATLLNP